MSKRGENIYRRADGRWEARYIVGYDPLSGKAKFAYIYADSYKKARELKREKAKLGDVRNNKKKLVTEKRQEPTVRMCLQEWMEHREGLGELRKSTFQLYDRQIRHHILPVLGDCRISRLTESVLEEFRSLKRKNGRLDGKGGLSSSVVEGLMCILYAMLQYEWEKGRIQQLPRRKEVRSARKAVQENQAFSEEEQKKVERVLYQILKNRQGRGIHIGILFAFYTGLRVGELGGLLWKDIDLNKATVSVRRTLQRISAPEGSRKKTILQLGPPKSESSCRVFPVKEEMIAILRKYKMALPKDRTGSEMPIFSNKKGGPVEPRLFQKYFARLLEVAGVEKRKFHTLRHTFATRCVEKNMDIQSLSECLGHSSSGITLRIYTHSFTEHKRRCMKRLSFKCDIEDIEKAPFGEGVC